MDYDEETNSIGFEDFVDDVVENKSTEYPDLKTVVIDTYDQLVEIAKPEVIRMHNAENPEKPVKSIKAAFGGYMAGEDKATEIVLNKLWELKSVGVHFIIIGHVKPLIAGTDTHSIDYYKAESLMLIQLYGIQFSHDLRMKIVKRLEISILIFHQISEN